MPAKSKIGEKHGTELVLQALESLEEVANCVCMHRVFFPILKSFNKTLNIDCVWFHTFYENQSVKEN